MDMSTKTFAVPAALSLHTADLVKKFAEEMAHKLYKAEQKGRGGWESNTWEGACRQALHEHIGKGDPIDVANFLAFMWHHGWPINLDIEGTALLVKFFRNEGSWLGTLGDENGWTPEQTAIAAMRKLLEMQRYPSLRQIPSPSDIQPATVVANTVEYQTIESATAKAIVTGVDCPYCDCYHNGFVQDPRGKDMECEDCGKTFHIEDEVELS